MASHNFAALTVICFAANLEGILAVQKIFAGTPSVAVFDTGEPQHIFNCDRQWNVKLQTILFRPFYYVLRECRQGKKVKRLMH